MGRLDDKVAVITGGASGIGEATAQLFVKEGARVVIADIQDEKGERLAKALGAHAVYQRADVSQEAQVEAVVQRAVEAFGRLDCMFNNAGTNGVGGSIDEIPVEGFDETVGILLRGVFLGMKHAARVMKRQGSGSIISTSSVAGILAGYGFHVYSAAKAAIIHLTRSVAMELGESGVRVNCICPGFIATPIYGRTFGMSIAAADKAVEAVKPMLVNTQPIRRTGLPLDVAQAALWLASDDASFVNGHMLVVDGGLTGGRMWSDVQRSVAEFAAAMGMET